MRGPVVRVLPAPTDPELLEAYAQLVAWNATCDRHDPAACEVCTPGYAELGR